MADEVSAILKKLEIIFLSFSPLPDESGKLTLQKPDAVWNSIVTFTVVFDRDFDPSVRYHDLESAAA